MNKHETIESDLLFLEQRYPFLWFSLKSYIKDFKELEKDVQRYWDLKNDRETYYNEDLMRELSKLSVKIFQKKEGVKDV